MANQAGLDTLADGSTLHWERRPKQTALDGRRFVPGSAWIFLLIIRRGIESITDGAEAVSGPCIPFPSPSPFGPFSPLHFLFLFSQIALFRYRLEFGFSRWMLPTHEQSGLATFPPLSNALRFYTLKTTPNIQLRQEIRGGNQVLASKENYWRLRL